MTTFLFSMVYNGHSFYSLTKLKIVIIPHMLQMIRSEYILL